MTDTAPWAYKQVWPNKTPAEKRHGILMAACMKRSLYLKQVGVDENGLDIFHVSAWDDRTDVVAEGNFYKVIDEVDKRPLNDLVATRRKSQS